MREQGEAESSTDSCSARSSEIGVLKQLFFFFRERQLLFIPLYHSSLNIQCFETTLPENLSRCFASSPGSAHGEDGFSLVFIKPVNPFFQFLNRNQNRVFNVPRLACVFFRRANVESFAIIFRVSSTETASFSLVDCPNNTTPLKR